VQEAMGWAMPTTSQQHTVNAVAAFWMDNQRTTTTEEQQYDNGRGKQ